jgi:DNA-binding LytR/AlgR family response regulator
MQTNKMNIALCDDNQATLDIVSSSLESIFSSNGIVTSIHKYNDIRTLESVMSSEVFDLLFLDIDMPVMDGISFAKKLRSEGNSIPIIYVSNREDKVFESLEAHPFGFIRKSHFLSDITSIVKQYLDDQNKVAPKRIIIVKHGTSQAVPLDEVIYVEGSRKNQLLYLKDNAEPVVMNSTMEKITSDLEAYGFITCYKGILVNYRYISVIRDDDIVLTTGKTIPMSRRKAAETKEKYLDLMRSKSNFIF